ncbi:MAG: PorV/PorQ family protein [Candidatus Edwardsbacteria bacterium]|nr:PorV/PorQ family protein [Candidatus Edwardsbacteria bacterium]
MKKILIILLLTALNSSLKALTPGDRSGVFMTLPQGARPTAMGEAFCAVTGDIYSSYWNPAGLADLGRMTFSASMAPTYLDMYYGYLAGAMTSGQNAFSLALSHFNYGDMIGLDEHARNQTVFNGSDLGMIAGYARKFPGLKMQAGVNAKLLHESIEQESASSVMFDIGAIKKFQRVTLGSSLRNIGPGLNFHDESGGLPITFSLGATYYFYNTPLVPAVSIDVPLDDAPVLSLGAEYSLGQYLALRAGLKTERDQGFLSWMRFGFGTSIRGISVDYAMIPGKDLGSTHMFSIGYHK